MSTGKLFTNKEKRILQDQANLYSLYVTCDYVARAHSHNTITEEQYEETCLGLITQYKTAIVGIQLEQFLKTYDIEKNYARGYKLLSTGQIEKAQKTSSNQGTKISELVHAFATRLHTIQRGMKANSPNAKMQVATAKTALEDILFVYKNYFSMVDVAQLDKWLSKFKSQESTELLTAEEIDKLMTDVKEVYNNYKRSVGIF